MRVPGQAEMRLPIVGKGQGREAAKTPVAKSASGGRHSASAVQNERGRGIIGFDRRIVHKSRRADSGEFRSGGPRRIAMITTFTP